MYTAVRSLFEHEVRELLSYYLCYKKITFLKLAIHTENTSFEQINAYSVPLEHFEPRVMIPRVPTLSVFPSFAQRIITFRIIRVCNVLLDPSILLVMWPLRMIRRAKHGLRRM